MRTVLLAFYLCFVADPDSPTVTTFLNSPNEKYCLVLEDNFETLKYVLHSFSFVLR